jgi:predicted nucleic acid-binding Zn finger protein
MLTRVRKSIGEGSLTEYWIWYTNRALVCTFVRAGKNIDYTNFVKQCSCRHSIYTFLMPSA